MPPRVKVKHLSGRGGKAAANQFVITTPTCEVFQSYDTIIVQVDFDERRMRMVTLDAMAWDYSVTTARYRNQFLRETTQERKLR